MKIMKVILKYLLIVFAAFFSGAEEVCAYGNKNIYTFDYTNNLNGHWPIVQVNSLASIGLRQGQFDVTLFDFMANHLSIEKRKRIFYLLCEGNGIRSITRLIGCSKNTVSELQKRYCCIIEHINKKYITDLKIDDIEADEIRTFVRTKSNIRWIYIALDRKSRLVINFHIGKRDTEDAKKFLTVLSSKLSEKTRVSTDCLTSYISAVAKTPYGRIEAATSSIGLLRTKNPDKKLGRAITNRIENHNGVVRQHVSRLTRKTRCFSKKEEGLRQQLTLFFFYYNFIKRHQAIKCTPALEARITDEAFWENKLLEYDMMFTETTKVSDNCNNYGRTELPTSVISIGKKDSDEFIDELKNMYEIKNKKRGEYKKRAKVIQLAS